MLLLVEVGLSGAIILVQGVAVGPFHYIINLSDGPLTERYFKLILSSKRVGPNSLVRQPK